MRRLLENITFALVALCCSVVACVTLIAYGFYLVAALFVLLSGALFFKVLSINRRDHEKIDFIFNALESDDYSFNFSERSDSVQEVAFNSLLNRIKSLLTNAKQRTIEQEKYYEYIFDKLNTGVIIINEKGNILQANQAMYDLLGVDILGHTNHIARVSESLSEAVLSCTEGQSQEVVVASEAGEKAYSIMASKVRLRSEELKIVAVSSLDQALDRKEIEAWSKLTRVLTHEIMNSLAPITSLSETLMGLNKDPELQQGLSTICQTNKSLISFVENYRTFTRIQRPEKSPFEIKPLLENLARLICPADVEVQLNVEPEETMLFADENLILQVLVNLLKNGVQAMENNPTKILTINVYIRPDENIIVEISNNGPTITSEVVENLFLPFFTTKPGGKGIGLSISKQIMQLHNGTLTLTANQAEKVTFTLLFR